MNLRLGAIAFHDLGVLIPVSVKVKLKVSVTPKGSSTALAEIVD